MNIMKHILRFFKLISACLLTVALFSCSIQELNTDQYPDDAVNLASFGPNPVMRGATLRFFGSNLEKIVEVNVPGVSPITDIEVVSSGAVSEIRVQLPVDGPEPGKVTLKASTGQTFTTKAELTYDEPIRFDSFSTVNAVSMPGERVTLRGDYMNLIKSVTFAGGETVAVEPVSRYEAKVVIPFTAVSGPIILSDEGEIANLLYSEEDLVIGDPTVSSLKITPVKPEETATITGTYLQMIRQIRLAGDVTVTDFTISEDGKILTFSLPAETRSGDVFAVSFADKEFKAGAIEMVKPTGMKVNPTPVKAGSELEITGKDLDLVTAVSFPDAKNITFTYANNKITVKVPAAATEGDITFTMANADAVTVPYTLVHPTVTGVSPLALMAGETITLTGTDLDLITGIKLGGKDVEFTAEARKILVTTANTSVSGKLTLTLANGETVEPAETITLSYDSFIIVNELPSAVHIGDIVTLKGENFLMIENIFIGEAKVNTYYLRTDDEIQFVMPYNRIGTYPIRFQLLSGEMETCPSQIQVLLELNRIIAWEGSLTITWGSGGRVAIPASKFEGVKAGTRMRFYYTQKDQTWAQAQVNYGDWSQINFNGTGEGAVTFNGTLVPTNIYGWFSDGILDRCTEVILTQTILDNIQAKKGAFGDMGNCGMIIQGSDLIFTKVEILQEIPQEKTIWEGSRETGNYANNLELGTENDWINAGLAIGNVVKVYFTAANPAEWSMQIFDGHWSMMSFPEIGAQFNQDNSTGAADGYISFTVDEGKLAAMTAIQNWGYALIVQGKNLTVTQITML
ncbi:MAG: hypothetical protein GX125_04930 [Bacteroidales bacterium]|jgi:hypothetical protein|nr:hypothetical protein [Bacteroidota bacterium]NLN99590.1 hypothetical protein [Bacteroidales bacterium]